jgi:hypothetical protein
VDVAVVDVGLYYRSDSALCNAYVKGGLNKLSRISNGEILNIKTLSEHVAFTNFLHNSTSYIQYHKREGMNKKDAKERSLREYVLKNGSDFSNATPIIRTELKRQVFALLVD